MIVLGTDAHKRSHTSAAVGAATGELQGSETVQATAAGSEQLLLWARASSTLLAAEAPCRRGV
jgi:hypothetical protein